MFIIILFNEHCIYLIKGSGKVLTSGLINKKIINFEVLDDLGYGPFKSVSG